MSGILVRKRLPIALLVLGIGLVDVSGCAIGGKSASYDSTSKMPWFGLELKSRKRKSDGPLFPSVRLDKDSKSRVETVADASGGLTGTAKSPRKSSLALPTTDQSLGLDPTASDEPVSLDFR